MTALGSGSGTARPADALSNSSPGQQSTYTVLREQPAAAASEIASANWLSSAAVKAVVAGEMTASEAQASAAQTTQALSSQGSVPLAGAVANPPATSETCVPCSSANEVVCIDSDHYGLCDLGCARSQLLAPGTVCTDGQILRRDV
ncbi:hypothetical protein AA0119_g11470 [Alternaria tenuissima]|uniref:Uncharacterized protein n=2 Tax=Alternaria alternata complex TaxID=187734 RepID=A0A4Q4MZH1_ALTAL|nr:hypothetical protein AA0115_g12017 [Alternaria tenuissima]RYN64911.1 hypothetical protein AA0117_g12352 [Alternaria alternata]RYN35577.1 hypothetical protein AA0114_g11742 [Alternaria tenuissima]RYN89290.1 hypothetical protein AA0119_g11470 [Alternaria tenuissima]RYO05926.1 hypothetical protein AA0121_g12235 [Alternaria tenuissima]